MLLASTSNVRKAKPHMSLARDQLAAESRFASFFVGGDACWRRECGAVYGKGRRSHAIGHAMLGIDRKSPYRFGGWHGSRRSDCECAAPRSLSVGP